MDTVCFATLDLDVYLIAIDFAPISKLFSDYIQTNEPKYVRSKWKNTTELNFTWSMLLYAYAVLFSFFLHRLLWLVFVVHRIRSWTSHNTHSLQVDADEHERIFMGEMFLSFLLHVTVWHLSHFFCFFFLPISNRRLHNFQFNVANRINAQCIQK